MFCVRKTNRWRSLGRTGQTRKLDYPSLLFEVLQTLLRSKAAWATPNGISNGPPLPCVAPPIRRALQSALIINSSVANQRGTVVQHRHTEPQKPVSRFYPVSVPPILMSVLDVVVENEKIYVIDQVKVSSPWNKVGLTYPNSHQSTSI